MLTFGGRNGESNHPSFWVAFDSSLGRIRATKDRGMTRRRLEEGWDHRPDWRALVTEEKLREQPNATLGQLLAWEEDLLVRHALRFKKTGAGAAAKVLGYAYSCHETRTKNIASAIIRSMTVAGFTPAEIGKRLGTEPLNVVVYQRMFWDLKPNLLNRAWIGSVITPTTPINPRDPIAIREAMLLSTAFQQGKRGLRHLLDGTTPTTPGELEELTVAIRGAVTFRAHQFLIQSLSTGLDPEDLQRFVELMRLPATQDTSRRKTKMDDFRRRITAAVMEKKCDASSTKSAQVPPPGDRKSASAAAALGTS